MKTSLRESNCNLFPKRWTVVDRSNMAPIGTKLCQNTCQMFPDVSCSPTRRGIKSTCSYLVEHCRRPHVQPPNPCRIPSSVGKQKRRSSKSYSSSNKAWSDQKGTLWALSEKRGVEDSKTLLIVFTKHCVYFRLGRGLENPRTKAMAAYIGCRRLG